MQSEIHGLSYTKISTIYMYLFTILSYTTLIADFADSAIDRGHSHRGRLSFGQSPSLPRVHVRDDRVE